MRQKNERQGWLVRKEGLTWELRGVDVGDVAEGKQGAKQVTRKEIVKRATHTMAQLFLSEGKSSLQVSRKVHSKSTSSSRMSAWSSSFCIIWTIILRCVAKQPN